MHPAMYRDGHLPLSGTVVLNNNIWPKRFLVLDVSRSFAALSVVMWHWQHFAYNGTCISGDFDRTRQPLYGIFKILYEHGLMAVGYFIILSDFIFLWLYRSTIEDRTTDFIRFGVYRISRLYPLHRRVVKANCLVR